MNRKSIVRTIAGALLGLVAILGLTACGDDESSDSNQVGELKKRGFSDVNAQTDGAEWGVYYVQAGVCRLKVEWSKKEGFTLVENSTQGEAHDLTVKEPSVVKLRQVEALNYCFAQEPSVSVTPSK